MKGEVRIIGGIFRGRKLSFPEKDDLRPTPNRVKETLFNWLMNDIRNARCLDAFAGSGSLGFEALSRGAKEVVMIESSREVFACLERNSQTFGSGSSQLQLLQEDSLSYLESTEDPFDIIFLDPPFKGPYLDQCLQIIHKRPCLTEGGLLYVESPKEMVLNAEDWLLRKAKKASQVYYALFEKILPTVC